MPPAPPSVGVPAGGGSVISGHSSSNTAQHDVTPPDEMYNVATLPRDVPPPRYQSEDLLNRGQANMDVTAMMPAHSTQLPPPPAQPQLDFALSRSRSSSQPLETSM